MPLRSSGLPQITDGKFIQFRKDLEISFLSTDSRNTVLNQATLFFAIRGQVHDGHEYIRELYSHQVRQFIIEDDNLNLELFPYANFFLTENSVRALQDVARRHRSKFRLHTVGITGSNGKTMVKEWLSQLLSWKYSVIKTPKSYNSQIGVPLSVWQIQEYHQVAVFEAGISKRGEMEKLEKIIKPTVGVLTNIGPAHDEGFSSRKEKLIEKLKLFPNVESLIYHPTNHLSQKVVDEQLPHVKKISWGSGQACSYRVKTTQIENKNTRIDIRKGNAKQSFSFPFIDMASVENIIHAIIYLIHTGWNERSIQEGLQGLSKISMRLEMKKGINDCYIIDDSYSNDLSGLEIALKYMNNQNQRNHKSVILTDILQSGMSSRELYQKTASLLNHFQLKQIITIGREAEKMKVLLKHPHFHFSDTDSFLLEYPFENFRDEIVLVKGARKFELERVVQKVQEKVHGTVLEIYLDALSHNLNIFRSYLDPSTKIMVMVKALAYGSGSIEVANLLEFHRIDYLGVAYVDEAITLRKNGISLPIMIMNPTSDAFEKIFDFRLEPEIYNLRLLKEIDQFTRRIQNSIKIHIKIDTGMHRLGFQAEDFNQMLSILSENPYLQVASVFSHLAAADDKIHDAYTVKQANQFRNSVKHIQSRIKQSFITHLANSAAIVRFPDLHFDMVRLGIGLYGFDNTGNIRDKLIPIGKLKTNISQIIHLKKDDSVGYGRKGHLRRDSRIATIAIGYADGFSRAFSNGKAHVYIHGHLVPVVGNVCMDMTMIDVTNVPANEGDEVIIFGPEHPLLHLADAIQTIPYEILTNVSERVKRVYVSE